MFYDDFILCLLVCLNSIAFEIALCFVSYPKLSVSNWYKRYYVMVEYFFTLIFITSKLYRDV